VGEITGDDLKFSDTEVHELFGTVFGMQLARNEIALVNRTAEGWAAGLVLMHEYFASKDPIDRSASLTRGRQSGFQDHVFDYLAQEVFAHLPAEMQVDYPDAAHGFTDLPASAHRADDDAQDGG
jgi:ATP/maltotriose-dependent transcriptional regulator MalT